MSRPWIQRICILNRQLVSGLRRSEFAIRIIILSVNRLRTQELKFRCMFQFDAYRARLHLSKIGLDLTRPDAGGVSGKHFALKVEIALHCSHVLNNLEF